MPRTRESGEASIKRKPGPRETPKSRNNAAPTLTDMKTWTGRLGRTKLRTFTGAKSNFWLEQNAAKASRWGKLARQGHEIAWEFGTSGGHYTGRMLVDGEVMTPKEAVERFLRK